MYSVYILDTLLAGSLVAVTSYPCILINDSNEFVV